MLKFNRQQLGVYNTQMGEVCMQHTIFTYGRSHGVTAIFVT